MGGSGADSSASWNCERRGPLRSGNRAGERLAEVRGGPSWRARGMRWLFPAAPHINVRCCNLPIAYASTRNASLTGRTHRRRTLNSGLQPWRASPYRAD
ncbi:hypothetical protein MRB53_042273 [Persea americana]|nr:hypothetical protein MRB53_042273 [Persea americana]